MSLLYRNILCFNFLSMHGKKGFVMLTKSFVKIWIAKTFCYNNKMFSSVNKTFGCCSKIFGSSNKTLFVVPTFVAVTKPFFPCGKHVSALLLINP